MPACTFISNSKTPRTWILRSLVIGVVVAIVALLSFSGFPNARAAEPATQGGAPAGGDEFSETPFTRYGEFSEDEEEAESTLFFQYGRFFGFSAGGGWQGVTGNRGVLWKGGFPLLSFKVHYWFNFNFALQLEFTTVPHNYSGTELTTVTMTKFAVDFKYFIDTTNLADAVTFASPYLLFGAGAFTKTENSPSLTAPAVDSQFGVEVGAGLQFPISHKRVYFDLEFKFIFVSFNDRNNDDFSSTLGIADLSGSFYNITGNLVFTW